jgi:hypothetical protein
LVRVKEKHIRQGAQQEQNADDAKRGESDSAAIHVHHVATANQHMRNEQRNHSRHEYSQRYAKPDSPVGEHNKGNAQHSNYHPDANFPLRRPVAARIVIFHKPTDPEYKLRTKRHKQSQNKRYAAAYCSILHIKEGVWGIGDGGWGEDFSLKSFSHTSRL